MIQVRNLTKKYGDFFALSDVSFDSERGKIYGFLGPNGAGKSTTMNIITGCLSATGGSVLVDGKDIFDKPIEAKRKIGYLPELPPLYTEMTPAEYLAFVAHAKGVSYEDAPRKIRESMEQTQITHVADKLIRNLSKGYRQRVGIAQALLGDPELIILDEPTVGLDPKQILEIRELIRKLGKTKTVILSSHILAEIRAVCDHLLILSHGRLVANASIRALEESATADARLCLEIKGEEAEALSILKEIEGVWDVEPEAIDKDGICRFSLKTDPERDPRDVIFYTLAEHKMPLVEMLTKSATLEDIFLSLTSQDVSGEDEAPSEAPTAEEYIPVFSARENEETEEKEEDEK